MLGFADCGVVPEPNAEQLADIAIAAADNYYAATDLAPRVAMLSFSTKGSAKHASVDVVLSDAGAYPRGSSSMAKEFAVRCRHGALGPGARRRRTVRLRGEANVFVFPSLSAGNINAKIAQRMGNYQALGPLIQGLALPSATCPRGCSGRHGRHDRARHGERCAMEELIRPAIRHL